MTSCVCPKCDIPCSSVQSVLVGDEQICIDCYVGRRVEKHNGWEIVLIEKTGLIHDALTALTAVDVLDTVEMTKSIRVITDLVQDLQNYTVSK